MDLNTAVTLTYCCARLGYEGPALGTMHEKVVHLLESGQDLSLPMFVHLLWSFTEMGMRMDWVRGQAIEMIDRMDESTDSFVVLRLAWILTFLEENIPDNILNLLVAGSKEKLPVKEMLAAQQVALHLDHRQSLATESPEFGVSQLSEPVQNWVDEVLSFRRDEIYCAPPTTRQMADHKNMPRVPSDRWLSDALVALRVKHDVCPVISNVYRCSIRFPDVRLNFICTQFHLQTITNFLSHL
jgi:hypothetical protein